MNITNTLYSYCNRLVNFDLINYYTILQKISRLRIRKELIIKINGYC